MYKQIRLKFFEKSMVSYAPSDALEFREHTHIFMRSLIF